MGFKPKHVFNFTMDVCELGYDEQRGANFYRDVREHVRNLPGVTSASFAYSVPLGSSSHGAATWKAGQEGLPESEVSEARLQRSESGLFPDDEGIELVEGRTIEKQDQGNSHRVAVINETMARNLWPK